MDKTSAAYRIIDCVRNMSEWNAYDTFSYFTVKSKVNVRTAFRVVYEMGLDADLSRDQKNILNRFRKSVYSAGRYIFCLDDTLIMQGKEIDSETKIKAINMLKELGMSESMVYFRVCIRKILEEEAA